MPAQWQRVNPVGLLMLGQKGGTMLMATAAKKHITLFTRSRRAPHAGNRAVKDAFAIAAKGTLGIHDRRERNRMIGDAVRGKGPGKRIIRSKSKKYYGKILREVITR